MKKIFFKIVKLKYLFYSFFVLGIFLFLLNIFGLFRTLRNPEIYRESSLDFDNAITLTEKDFYQKLKEADNLSIKEYVEVANRAVNQGIAHYWNDAGIKVYNLTVPFWENYLLYLKSFIYPNTYKKYEFCNFKKAVERGVGLCSQQATVLMDILNEKKIESYLVHLHGHIVVTALVNKNENEWWILDPDFGIVFENDLKFLENNLDIVESKYKDVVAKSRVDNSRKIAWIANIITIYGNKNDHLINEMSDYFGKNYCEKENFDYILIWVIPVFLVIPGIIIFIKKHARHKL